MQNVAIVGFGFMGMTHAAAIAKMKGVKIAAIVDKDVEGISEKIHSKSGNFSIEDIDPQILEKANKYDDLDECLRNEKLDAVHVCVHTNLHYQIAKKLLAAGLHVLLEKPMTLDEKEGLELIRLAKENNCVFMVGHVVRFMPPYQQLRQWVEEKTYGKLKFLSVSRFSGVPLWGQWKEKQTAFGTSGGALFDLLIHDIDFVNDLLGSPDDIQSHVLPGYLSENDYVSALWKYEKSGIKVKVEGGNIFHSTYPFQASFSAQFENASVFYSTSNPGSIQVATHEKLDQIDLKEGPDGFFNEIEYFYQTIKKQQSPDRCMPESSLETIRLCYRHLNK